MDRMELAWAAGLYEGEGTISTRKDRPGSPLMALGMTDEDIVLRFAQVVGYGHIYPRKFRDGERKQLWYWQIAQFERVQATVAMLWPWLGTRRRAQAARVLRSCKAGRMEVLNRTLTWRLYGKARRDLSPTEYTAYTKLVRKTPR